MTKREQMRLSLMLAFQTVITRGENAKSEAAVQKIISLAKLMNEFCDLHLPHEAAKSGKLNADINLYGEELRKNGSVALPDDRETLIELYDQLQHRKTQYSQWVFYAQASTEEVAEAIIRLLKEIDNLRDGGGK